MPKKEGKYSQNLLKSIKGGLIGNLLVAGLLNVALILSVVGVFGAQVSPYLAVAFSFSPYALYAYVINAIPWFHPLNDGSQIKRLKISEEERQAVDNLYAIQKQLLDGKTYEEIPKGYFTVGEAVSEEVKVYLTTYAFRRAIESGDSQLAEALAGVLDSVCYNEEEILCELLYWYVITENEEKIKEYSSILSFSVATENPTVFRVLLSYAKYRKDEDYFAVAKPTAIKLCKEEKLLKGDALYNLKLIERL